MIANITIAMPPRTATRSASCGETGHARVARPRAALDRAHARDSGLSPPVV